MRARIRIASNIENCERILSFLRDHAKTWGRRKLIKIKKFNRKGTNKYSRIFGSSEWVYYVDGEFNFE